MERTTRLYRTCNSRRNLDVDDNSFESGSVRSGWLPGDRARDFAAGVVRWQPAATASPSGAGPGRMRRVRRFHTGGGVLRVEVTATTTGPWGPAPDSLEWRILEVLADTIAASEVLAPDGQTTEARVELSIGMPA